MPQQENIAFENPKHPFEITASLDDSAADQEIPGLLQTIVSLSDKITLKTDGTDARKPSFALNRIGEPPRIRFAAIPMGHEFTSLVLALLQIGGHPPKIEAELIEQIKNLDGADFDGELRFETYMSLSCHNCPDVVQALNLMAVLNPRVTSVVIDGGLYQKEVEERQILAVPMVFLNGALFGQGRMEVDEIVAKLDTGAAVRDAVKLNAKDAYDVLIVGGGPAGAAAAVYAARKGIRTSTVRTCGSFFQTPAVHDSSRSDRSSFLFSATARRVPVGSAIEFGQDRHAELLMVGHRWRRQNSDRRARRTPCFIAREKVDRRPINPKQMETTPCRFANETCRSSACSPPVRSSPVLPRQRRPSIRPRR